VARSTSKARIKKIETALAVLDQKNSILIDRMIAAGRGNERPSEYLKKKDPLSLALLKNYEQRFALMEEKRALTGSDYFKRTFNARNPKLPRSEKLKKLKTRMLKRFHRGKEMAAVFKYRRKQKKGAKLMKRRHERLTRSHLKRFKASEAPLIDYLLSDLGAKKGEHVRGRSRKAAKAVRRIKKSLGWANPSRRQLRQEISDLVRRVFSREIIGWRVMSAPCEGSKHSMSLAWFSKNAYAEALKELRHQRSYVGRPGVWLEPSFKKQWGDNLEQLIPWQVMRAESLKLERGRRG
jgi:hypothetical protein